MKTVTRSAPGWSEQETQTLFSTADLAIKEGAPIKSVFEQVARLTGRKPNSIRNYYYLKLRERTGCGRTAFVPFSDDESDMLIETILSGKAAGKSVRSIAFEMGSGDKKAMLRYQNKYRSLLRSDPERVSRVMDEMRRSGKPCADPFCSHKWRSRAISGDIFRKYGADPSALLEAFAGCLDSALSRQRAMFAELVSISDEFVSLDGMERISVLDTFVSDMRTVLDNIQKEIP